VPTTYFFFLSFSFSQLLCTALHFAFVLLSSSLGCSNLRAIFVVAIARLYQQAINVNANGNTKEEEQ